MSDVALFLYGFHAPPPPNLDFLKDFFYLSLISLGGIFIKRDSNKEAEKDRGAQRIALPVNEPKRRVRAAYGRVARPKPIICIYYMCKRIYFFLPFSIPVNYVAGWASNVIKSSAWLSAAAADYLFTSRPSLYHPGNKGVPCC